MSAPTWAQTRSVLSFLVGVTGLVYEARYAHEQSPEIIVGSFGLVVGTFVAVPESRAGRHRHHPEDKDD